MSTTEQQQFNADGLGKWGDEVTFDVERERLVAYAEATNDDLAQHVAGDIAPPVFAVVPAFEALARAAVEITPPEFVMRVVHGEQDFRFHRPIEPGMTLVTRAMPTGFHARSSGVVVPVRGETRTAEGQLVVEQYMTSFFRGATSEESRGGEPPSHGFDERLRSKDPVAEVAQAFDEDQTFRYSKASGDLMPIHLDDEVARTMGLPGIIIHGLCTMAFTSRAVIQAACPEDPTRLARLAVRFSKVVRPRQTITTRIWDAGGGRYAFETESDTGDIVIKDGLAEIAG